MRPGPPGGVPGVETHYVSSRFILFHLLFDLDRRLRRPGSGRDQRLGLDFIDLWSARRRWIDLWWVGHLHESSG